MLPLIWLLWWMRLSLILERASLVQHVPRNFNRKCCGCDALYRDLESNILVFYVSIVPHLGWFPPAKPYCSYDQAEKSSLHLSSCNHILLYSIHPIIPLIHILQSNHVIFQATLFKLIMQFRLTGRWLRQVISPRWKIQNVANLPKMRGSQLQTYYKITDLTWCRML